jgi:SPP1 family predicted phage head-tail adaptor
MMAAGRRDKRVLLENPGGSVPDGDGGYIEGWQPLDPAEVFAHIDPATTRDLERRAAGTVIASASHVIDLDYHPQVTVLTRITFGARQFQVTAVRNPDEANRELVVVAEELLGSSETP